MDGECSNTNVILFCDLCNLAVHQECYGVPYIPEGQWLCRRCLQSPSRSVECCLCPNRGGAFKQTDDGRWAHVVCGLWIPEVRFANTVFLEPIDSIDNIPPARWKLSCRVCKQRGVGACIQCHKPNCYTAFHVTCGLLAGLHMKMDSVRETSANGLALSVTVRKTAFCDVHTPHDSDCKPKLDDIAALGITTGKNKTKSPKKNDVANPVPVLFRGLMNFSPQCPWDKVQKIASLINVQRKNQFFQRLMAYWTLKRQTRNGVPLIRRLQFAKANKESKAPETPQKNAHHSKKKKEREKAAIKKAKDEFKEMIDERRALRRLRQDLERVRLLCELIRKREQRKRELVINHQRQVELKCFPFVYFLRVLLGELKEIDTQEIFAEPVSLDDVPDYLDHIKRPMDFETMNKKLESFEYGNIDLLESDFTVMVENCLSYNERDTIFFRAGVKMRDQGGTIIRQAKREIESIGFDPDSGLHTSERLTPKEELSDDKIMKEIDSFVNDDSREDLPLDEHLKRLLELQDKVLFLHHPVAKVKRQKLLKQEIIKLRRKMSMGKAGTSPGVGLKSSKKLDENQDSQGNSATDKIKKKNKPREVSPAAKDHLTPARRLRAGKEMDQPSEKPSSDKKAKRGRKRKADGKGDAEEDDENPAAKRNKLDQDTPEKAGTSSKNLSNQSPAKPGVNRRTAVLFTRKKQAINETPEESTPTPAKSDEKPSSSKKKVIPEDALENQETEVQNPASVPEKPEKPPGKKRGRKPKNQKEQAEQPSTKIEFPASSWRGPNAGPCNTESFKVYRKGGVIGETDESAESESATDAIATSENEDDDGAEDSDASSTAGLTSASGMNIQLEPLDLVWAKCRGYPWYPALIINPKMPRTGYLHNGVPIPVPPQEVLDMAVTHESPHYLILFFDSKRTWQWLLRDKLEPLGIDVELDKSKLVQSKKPSERKAVKKAYYDAVKHRCRVAGESVNLSGDSSGTEDSKDNK